MEFFLAIDLGASSGRHVIGCFADGKITLETIYRFKTGMEESPDGLVWNIPQLFKEIKEGIKVAFSKYPKIESISIDTWGVDYVLLNGEEDIPPYYAYRNKRTINSSKEVHSIIPFATLYRRTGIQFASFNTIYQLFDDLKKGRLEEATDYLMLPSYFTYRLTGIKTHEYTNESTGALLEAKTGEYDFDTLDKLGLPRKLFGQINKPGYEVGYLLPEIAEEVGGNAKVILCPSHDTASAFEAASVPEDGIILSSGTWSLLGIKSKEPIISDSSLKANYTNEGGVGYIRFLKNIMGMYIANRVREEVNLSIQEVNQGLTKSEYEEVFDVNDPSLNAPEKMSEAVLALLKDNPPKTNEDLFASIYRSMALAYGKAIDELEEITGKTYRSILVIGGGAKSEYLNHLIHFYTKKIVNVLPIEATALGNIKTQLKARKN